MYVMYVQIQNINHFIDSCAALMIYVQTQQQDTLGEGTAVRPTPK